MSEQSTQTRLGSSFRSPHIRARIYAFVSMCLEAGMTPDEAVASLHGQVSRANALPAEQELGTLLAKVRKGIDAGAPFGQALLDGFQHVTSEESAILGIIDSLDRPRQARILERLAGITAASQHPR